MSTKWMLSFLFLSSSRRSPSPSTWNKGPSRDSTAVTCKQVKRVLFFAVRHKLFAKNRIITEWAMKYHNLTLDFVLSPLFHLLKTSKSISLSRHNNAIMTFLNFHGNESFCNYVLMRSCVHQKKRSYSNKKYICKVRTGQEGTVRTERCREGGRIWWAGGIG